MGTTYVLRVDSNPAGISISVNGLPHTTPFNVTLPQGRHRVEAPSEVAASHLTYGFWKWEDGTKSLRRRINLVGDMQLRPFYASPVGVVVGDAGVAHESMGIAAAQKLFRDDHGHSIAVYLDESRRLSVVVCNGSPGSIGWESPFKSSVVAVHHATVRMGPDAFLTLAQSGSNTKEIHAISFRLVYDASWNVVGVAFDAPTLVDGSPAFTPAAIRADDGSVWAVWSKTGLNFSKLVAGHFDPERGWRLQDVAVDPAETKPMYPAIIQRPDNHGLYVFANHDSGSANARMAFNAAKFADDEWTWGVADLDYDASTSRSLPDAPDVDWDPTRNVVVVEHDRSQESRYAVFTLDAANVKTHIDTPVLPITNNEWGGLFVDVTTGNYILLFIDTSSRNGPLRYVRWSSGSWGPVQTFDSATDLAGITVRKDAIGSSEFLVGKGTLAPLEIRFRTFS